MFKEKQGDLGDLRKKSTFEINELLRRQEKLLCNRSFLNALPDRGAKVQAFADKLQSILEEREDVDSTARLFDTLSLTVEEKTPTRTSITQSASNLSEVVTEKYQTFHSNIFAKPLQEDSPKFRPNRTLKSTSIPEDIPKPAEYRKEVKIDKNREVNAAYSTALKYEVAKPLDLSESVRLQLAQQEKLEKLKAEQATGKLAERLGIKIGEFTVDFETTGSFREPARPDSEDEAGEVVEEETESTLDVD